MEEISYVSTNDPLESVRFTQAFLNGQASRYGLYMFDKKSLPNVPGAELGSLEETPYSDHAFRRLLPFVSPDIRGDKFKEIVERAYPSGIEPRLSKEVGARRVLELFHGPTYSFKDYAARFVARTLDYLLEESGGNKIVFVATSGDTGGAVADSLKDSKHAKVVVLYPNGRVSSGQRRQMTTLGGNVYALAVNGDFDVCQDLAKQLMNNRKLAAELTGDERSFTSANSISIGRLLPQMVYPFFAYSRLKTRDPVVLSIPSGNFGDMMGAVIAKYMGLPVDKIVVGVNENDEFVRWLESGEYEVRKTKSSPSSAMNVSHPSNLARLVYFYGGHMHDVRDDSGKVTHQGVIDCVPDMVSLKRDISAFRVSNKETYDTIKSVQDKHQILLDPHGAVAWCALDKFFGEEPERLSLVYQTAHAAKFPVQMRKAVGIVPPLPEGMAKQADLPERKYRVSSSPLIENDIRKASPEQLTEASNILREIFEKRT